jgi:hypothetical protein
MTLRKTSIALSGLSIAAVCLVVWALSPGQQNGSNTGEVAAAPDAARAKAARGEEVNQGLEAQLQEARADALEKAAKVEELQRQLTTAKTPGTPPSKPPEWLRDPEMIKVMKSEAASAATRSATALIDAGLAEHLQLSEEQAEALKKLLIERNSALWDHMLLPLTVGELDQSDRAAAAKAMKQALERNATEMKTLVGDEGFKTFEWFERTQPDRDLVRQFTPQFAKMGQGLSPEQQSYLLTVTTEEREAFPFKHEFGDPLKIDYEHWDDNFTDEKVNTHFQQMAQLNERIFQRAQLLLTPEQVAVLRELHAEQLRRSMFTVRNTKAMLGQKR